MALPSPQPDANSLIPVVQAEVIPGCSFEYDDGRKCYDLKIFARNLCCRHYNQLRRLGAFDSKPTATPGEAISNIESERIEKARSILRRATPHLARLAVKASKVAADKGDAKPSIALLQATDVIKPPQKDSNTSSPGITINVGVKLAGQQDK